jgi:rhodanese-related sulfurtransferase/DNA-binding transcriptional ArsR family regulator
MFESAMGTTKRQLKQGLYDQLARIGKAFGSGPRLEILDLLCQGPRSVEAVATEVEQPVANASHHLQALRRAGLVDAERDGARVIYRAAGDDVVALLGVLRRVAEARLAEIERITHQFLHERNALDPVDRDALAERVQRGEVTVLDVRPSEEFAAGHLPGAISIPLTELQRRLKELPRRKEIVAYCRGPFCVMGIDAVELLRAKGYRALRMEDGVAEWRARGLPVEASQEGMAGLLRANRGLHGG